MTRHGKATLFALLIIALALPASGTEVPTTFAATHYYILSLGEMPSDVSALVSAAQSAGYSLLQYGEAEITPAQAALTLDDAMVLITDSGRFYLRDNGYESDYAFTVRPAEVGYELVINPTEDVAISDTLGAVLVSLQGLGILGSDVNLDFSSYAKADLKGPASPEGVLIDSTLYGLVVAEDWFAYSALKGLTQVGLRVEVVAEKIPGGALDTSFSDFVVDDSATLVKLLLPIDELLALATSSTIGYVRTAYEPSVP